VIVVDDASTDDTVARVRALGDARVSVHVNPERLGMLRNTNRAWALACERHPRAEFRALASDHDFWAPTWLETLRDALAAHPRAVLAAPRARRVDAAGEAIPGYPGRSCDTTGMADPWGRLRAAYRAMVAGDMIYGLFRAAPFDTLGAYDPVLVPDRLLLARLALLGEFVGVEEVLWERRFAGLADLDRQRRLFWPEGAPRSARLPWWLAHAWVAARDDRHLAAALLREGARLRLVRRAQRARLRVGTRLERPARSALARSTALRDAVQRDALPLPTDTREVLRGLLPPSGREAG